MVSSIRPYKGTYPTIASSTYVDPSAVLVGDITLGEDASIWPLVAARGDVNYIKVGARSNVQDGTVLHQTTPHRRSIHQTLWHPSQ